MVERVIPEPFSGVYTSLEDLKAEGWATRSNGYSWWWEKRRDDGSVEARVSAPYWMRQLMHNAESRGYDRGKRDTRAAFREAFGVAGPRVKVKDTPEFPAGENEEQPKGE